MSHQHLTASQIHCLISRATTEETMIWIRIVTVCTFMSLLEAHKECTKHIKWDHLIQSLNSMGTAISHDCAFDYEESSLCDPHHLVNTVNHNAVLLVDIVKKAKTMYMENPNPEALIEALHRTHHTLSNCAHDLENVEREPVITCFNKFEAFLKKKSHSHCAWEIINSKLREILQRLEKRFVRRRR